MKNDQWLFWSVLLLCPVVLWLVIGFFSPKAKLERRRRRSHTPILPQTKRPSVRLSVKPPKERP